MKCRSWTWACLRENIPGTEPAGAKALRQADPSLQGQATQTKLTLASPQGPTIADLIKTVKRGPAPPSPHLGFLMVPTKTLLSAAPLGPASALGFVWTKEACSSEGGPRGAGVTLASPAPLPCFGVKADPEADLGAGGFCGRWPQGAQFDSRGRHPGRGRLSGLPRATGLHSTGTPT